MTLLNKNARWGVALLIMCRCAGVVIAQSQPPAPAPGKPAQEKQHKVTPNEGKAESKQESPAPESSGVDKGSGAPKTAHRKETGNNRGSETPRDWWAILASVLNLFFSGCLVALMWQQWRAMQEQARYMKDNVINLNGGQNCQKWAQDAIARCKNQCAHQ